MGRSGRCIRLLAEGYLCQRRVVVADVVRQHLAGSSAVAAQQGRDDLAVLLDGLDRRITVGGFPVPVDQVIGLIPCGWGPSF